MQASWRNDMGFLKLIFRELAGSKNRPRNPNTRKPSFLKPNPRKTSPWATQRQTQKKPVRLPVFPITGEIEGKVHVIDRDTIVLNRSKIRLAGVDAPELDQPWGQKSKWAMVSICKGQTITAKLNGEQSHDRLVGTCYLPDGCDIGAELIKQGLALDWSKFSGGKYRHLEPKGVRGKLRGAHHH